MVVYVIQENRMWWCIEYARLLRQGSPDDAVNLFVDVQFGQTAALRVVRHTDGHRLGALGDRHCDLKQLEKQQKEREEWDLVHFLYVYQDDQDMVVFSNNLVYHQ